MKSCLFSLKNYVTEMFKWLLVRLRGSRIFTLYPWCKNIIIVRNEYSIAETEDIKERLLYYAPEALDGSIIITSRVPLLSLIRGESILYYKYSNPFWCRLLALFGNVFFVNHRLYLTSLDWILFSNYYYTHVPDIDRSKNSFYRAIHKRKYIDSSAYIFGTGPSLASAPCNLPDNSFCIVCNTIVRDKELFKKLKPDFIVAGDAVYHFSFTEFAIRFRQDLHARLKDTDVYFVYPAIFDVLVQRQFGDVSDRLIPIPIGNHKIIHIDLLDRFELPALGNVLPLLLLPLACTVSKKVFLWGFDGRSPDDKVSAFWKNSEKHTYSELMHTLKLAFPFFYEYYVPMNNSANYISNFHGDELNDILSHAESSGFIFEMLHPSWTPTLAKRYKGARSRNEYYGIKESNHT